VRAGAEEIEYATVQPDWIPGLAARTDSKLGDPYHYFVTWPTIESFPLLGDEAGAQVNAWREDFEEPIGAPVPGSPIRQEFNVSYEFLVASGDVIGLRFQIFEFPGAGGANLSRTLWFDLQTQELVPATALLDGDQALKEVAALALDALRRDRPDLSLPEVIQEGTAPTAENYHSLGFAPDGALVVEFDEYQVGPGAAGSPRVLIPAEVAEPLLSDFGRRARAEAVSPSRNLAIPAVTPTPVPSPVAPPATGVDCRVMACIALTFDDGPAGPTTELLDLLKQRGVRVTFFVVGVNATHQGSTLARAYAEGHQIGNHTYSHRDLTKLSGELIRAEVDDTSRVIEEAIGVPPLVVRPPYGATDDHVLQAVGLPVVLWSVDPRDWADHDSELVASRVLASAQRGSIILLHDTQETTVRAVPDILDGLAELGLTPVTVSQLLGTDLAPGKVYRNGS
jgi:peptidoglycan/xylan/chitin deacetylase (PgdA/CDA1 family)